MSHEIESEYIEDWYDEKTQCQRCTSYRPENNGGFCAEAQSPVPADAHCDFFQAID